MISNIPALPSPRSTGPAWPYTVALSIYLQSDTAFWLHFMFKNNMTWLPEEIAVASPGEPPEEQISELKRKGNWRRDPGFTVASPLIRMRDSLEDSPLIPPTTSSSFACCLSLRWHFDGNMAISQIIKFYEQSPTRGIGASEKSLSLPTRKVVIQL